MVLRLLTSQEVVSIDGDSDEERAPAAAVKTAANVEAPPAAPKEPTPPPEPRQRSTRKAKEKTEEKRKKKQEKSECRSQLSSLPIPRHLHVHSLPEIRNFITLYACVICGHIRVRFYQHAHPVKTKLFVHVYIFSSRTVCTFSVARPS